MKKNDVFTFTAPNGVEVTAVCLDKELCTEDLIGVYLCTHVGYSQNRLFVFTTRKWYDANTGEIMEGSIKFVKTIVDYAILPDYDELMQLHSSMEYPQWEQNLEAEIQGMNDR